MTNPAAPLSWLRSVVRLGRHSASTIAVAACVVTLAPGRAQPSRGAGEAFDFFASVETLSRLTGCGERTVRDALAALTDAGLLLRVRRGGRRGTRDEASTYRLVTPNPADVASWELDPNPVENAGREPGPTRSTPPVGNPSNPADSATWDQFPTGTPTGSHDTTKSREEPKGSSFKSVKTPPALTRRPPTRSTIAVTADVLVGTLVSEFDLFWSTYPRKVSKGAARKAYDLARKKVSAGLLLTALEAQKAQLVRGGAKYCPHAATWLNGERWEDDVNAIAPPAISRRQQETDDIFAAATARAERRDALHLAAAIEVAADGPFAAGVLL
jgi:hypothetical protein